VSTPFQLCVDCADPHRLAAFWADALGYEVEDDTASVRRMIDAGYATEADTVVLPDGRRVWPDVACSDRSGDGRPRVLFQKVPEPKTVKNRLHLDLHVGPDDRDATVERLLGLGATRIGEGRQGPHSWVVLADPEGHEFCVA
jgi:catechol 2,3-dioxygenase-like lactoylglutathione lyase family enzyme